VEVVAGEVQVGTHLVQVEVATALHIYLLAAAGADMDKPELARIAVEVAVAAPGAATNECDGACCSC
jgi:hypothetical protein